MKKITSLILIITAVSAIVITAGCINFEPSADDGDTVTLYYKLYNEDGVMVDTNLHRSPMNVTLGSHTTIPGFENALYGMKINETKNVTVPPEEGYGEYLYDLTEKINLSDIEDYYKTKEIKKDVEIGDKFPIIKNYNDGLVRMTGEVISIDKSKNIAVIAMNMPYAGQTLKFEITVLTIEKARN